MKINKRRLLIAAVLLIVAGAAVLGVGRAVFKGNEGSFTMDTKSYVLSEITRIQIDTDSPGVVIKPSTGDRINLAWKTDQYVKYEAQLENGELSVDYRVGSDWLSAILLAPFHRHDYVLEIELPDSYTGGLVIRTASGTITVNTAAALNECSFTSVSGSVDASHINSQVSIEVHSTSGSVSVDTVHAEGDILIRTVSGSVEFVKSASLGGVSLQTTSGSVTVSEVNAVDGLTAKTLSGRIEASQIQCDADVTLESTSGSVRPSGVACKGFTAKTVSGSVSVQDLTADTIEMRSTSGSVNGTVNGSRDDYSITVSTVSGRSNLQNVAGGKLKTLKVSTVSGSVDVTFAGN